MIFYTLAFTLLSGLGVTFLNSESLLAVCFFIFLAFCLHNSKPFSQSLLDSTEEIHTRLLSCYVDSANNNMVTKKEKLAKKSMLLASIKALTI
jgi:hypothetical protein